MADLVITAANCVPVTGYTKTTGVAGTTITAGQPVYIDTTDSNKLKLCDVDASSLAATVAGIALHGASNGQPLSYITAGDITIGATVAVGVHYVASDTAGGIMPIADLDSGDYVSRLGYGISTTQIRMDIKNLGLAFA